MDISIKNLKSYVFEPKVEAKRLERANEIISLGVIATEKVDGTKLTLVRTQLEDANYEKNWIVAYKGTVLYASEFSHLAQKDRQNVADKSIGIGQYAIVFDHLKAINKNIKSIPKSYEFSVEFAQNKDTLTRTYTQKGGMFLRSYAKVDYRILNGNIHTNVIGAEETEQSKVELMAKKLAISSFPVFYKGKINQAELKKSPAVYQHMVAQGVDWNNPLNVIEKFSETMLAIPSTLGGTTEGVVLKLSDGRFFKVVQADQYSGDARGEKQAGYRLDPEKATLYFQEIRQLITTVVSKVGTGKDTSETLALVNREIARIPDGSLPKNEKKTPLQVRDDIHETLRLMVSKRELLGHETKRIGLIPIAGKPLHLGHWKLIEKAASENDVVIVYTSDKDRVKKNEFPIYGKDFLKFWTDIFIPSLPKNVKVKIADSPVRAVSHELGWFEQSATQDKAEVPTVKIYSDQKDAEDNFSSQELSKYSTLNKLGKIHVVGVDRNTTVNVSGTKMREFLLNKDKENFIKFLPPISNQHKEQIWNTLIQNAPVTEDVYKQFANEVIHSVYEGGWRDTSTQSTVITPEKVQKAMIQFGKFVSEFNASSGLPPIKLNGPVGSAIYYKDDLGDSSVTYGDVDVQIVLPVDSNDRPTQLEANKQYGERIREFIKKKRPNYIPPNLEDEQYGLSYLIFKVDGENIQVDLVLSYTITADWVKTRTTPEKGLKGFVTGTLLSSLGDAMNVVLGASSNPYFNTVDNKIVGSLVRKGATQHYLKSDEVFLEILNYYGKLAGVKNVDSRKLKGYTGLDKVDASFKKKCEAVAHLADALDDNNIFQSGVIVSKSGTVIKSRDEFLKYILSKFAASMENAKHAKKLDKAQTPEALMTIQKIQKHADLGTSIAQQLLREMNMLLTESGQSVAMVDPKTPKTINGEPAKATTKLSIVDKRGRDIQNHVSDDIKLLATTLNHKVGFWKKDNPYILNGHIFNGSSQFLMDPEKRGKLVGVKNTFGDVDIIIPKTKLDELEKFLDTIDDNQPVWQKTPKNSITTAFQYVGRTKSYASIPDQLVTLWYYQPAGHVVQVDFEGDDMETDAQGFEKPSEWTKFSKDSPWEDLTVGIKGLAGALMLRALARGTSKLDNAVVLTGRGLKSVVAGATELKDSDISFNAQHTVPSKYTLNTGGGGAGIREAYKFVKTIPYKGKPVNAYRFVEAKETKPEERIMGVDKIFKVLFGKSPTPEEKAQFRSFQGQLRMMKQYLKKPAIDLSIQRFKEILANEPLSEKERGSIANAAKTILGVSI